MNWYRATASVEIPITFSVRAMASSDEIHDAAVAEAEKMSRGLVLHVEKIEMTVDTSNK